MAFPIRPPTQLEKIQRVSTPAGRRYVTARGDVYPSVTTVLGQLSQAGIAAWVARVGEAEAERIRASSSERGNAVHAMAEDYLLGKTVTDGRFSHLFTPIGRWLDANLDEIWYIEGSVYSHDMGVAGATDLIGVVNGVPTVVDFKTSLKPKKAHWIGNYFMQCAAYAECLREMTGVDVESFRVVVVDEAAQLQVFAGKCRDHLPNFIDAAGVWHAQDFDQPKNSSFGSVTILDSFSSAPLT